MKHFTDVNTSVAKWKRLQQHQQQQEHQQEQRSSTSMIVINEMNEIIEQNGIKIVFSLIQKAPCTLYSLYYFSIIIYTDLDLTQLPKHRHTMICPSYIPTIQHWNRSFWSKEVE